MTRASRYLTAALVGALTLFTLAGPALAQGTCDPVVDSTGEVNLDDIRAAAQPLEDRGATVVVRSFDSVSGGSLEAEVKELVAQCFADGPADKRANLILLAVSVQDRQTWIEYGEDFQELSPLISSIQSDAMNPNFAAGDVTQGLVAGLFEVESALNQINGSETTVPSPSAPDDGSPIPAAPLAGGLAAIGAAGAGTVVLSRRRKLTRARQMLEDRAVEPRVRIGATRERAQRLNTQADIWEHTTTGATLEKLRERRAEARNAGTDAERAAALLLAATPNGIGNATKLELAEAESRLTKLVESLDRAKGALDRFDGFGDLIERLRVSLPAKQALMETEFDEAEILGAERLAQGWKVEAEIGRLRSARTLSRSLEFSPLSLDLLGLSEQLEAAEAELFATRHTLQTFPDREASLAEWAERLATSESAERQRVAGAESEFARVAAVHGSDSWRWASGHPDKALSHLNRSLAIRQACVEGPMAAQQFELAGHQLELAGLELVQADAFLDEVDALMVNLETARQQAPGVLKEAEDELAELIEFVSEHGNDLPREYAVEPGEISHALKGLTAELAKGRPNYLVVAQTALRIAHQVDSLLIQAQEEHKRVVALRRALAREIARADREIQRAERSVGWELFKSRDGKDLEELKNELAALNGSLEQQLVQAEDITADAVAIRERIIARRRRESTWIVVGGGGGWGGGSSRGGWGGGSGGSSSGGGGFGGGGFGGGGFGGGGFGGGGFGGGGGGSSW